jgi:DNA-binding MarR family transcriptional regulator
MMTSAVGQDQKRSAQVEYVSTELVSRAALLTRLAVRQFSGRLSRAEAGVLRALSRGPRRITELAELEGLAQPSVTLMVRRLEEGRLVTRGRDTADGRVVMVSLTDSGAAALEEVRAQMTVAMREYLTEMSDVQVDALASAVDSLQELIDRLQQGAVR